MGYKPGLTIKSVSLYKFPDVVLERAQKNLNISDSEMELVTLSLLCYFNAVKYSPNGVEMTDKPADELWHTFLLDTKAYMNFCATYIGFYVHHNPYLSTKVLTDGDMQNISYKHGDALDLDNQLYELLEIKTLYTDLEDLEKYLPYFSSLLSGKMSYNGICSNCENKGDL